MGVHTTLADSLEYSACNFSIKLFASSMNDTTNVTRSRSREAETKCTCVHNHFVRKYVALYGGGLQVLC